ncbi:sigma-54 interaction domain-containing protein [candidate division KSB1 bacterium]
MTQKRTEAGNVIFELSIDIIEALDAETGLCYIESAAGQFSVIPAKGSETDGSTIDQSIPIKDFKNFIGNDLNPVLYFDNTPIFKRSQKKSGKNSIVSNGIIFPIRSNDKFTAAIEIFNISEDKISSKKLLKAIHSLAQKTFDAWKHLQKIENNGIKDRNHSTYETRIVGESSAIHELRTMISRVAATNSTVLLKGETGTGKNIMAKSIHEQSSRKDMPFIKVNCAAIPENLLESELFGHEKGAYTGAHQRRIGRFERAHLGTIFLDEIGEIPLKLQVKLLNVLQDREIERLGGTQQIQVDTRVIAATNKNLDLAIEKGEFREDLYYRLNVLPITIPNLNARIDDIEPLTQHFIVKMNEKLNRRFEGIVDEAMFLLKNYSWPGNIRELENVLERAMVLGAGPVIQPNDLPQDIFGILDKVRQPKQAFQLRDGKKTLWEVEKGIIERALRELNWNQSKVARSLGITRNHLRYRIKKFGILKPEPV